MGNLRQISKDFLVLIGVFHIIQGFVIVGYPRTSQGGSHPLHKFFLAAINDISAPVNCIENGYDLAGSYAQRAQVYKEMGDEEASAADLENARNAMKAADAAEEAPEESVTEAFEATTEEAAE